MSELNGTVDQPELHANVKVDGEEKDSLHDQLHQMSQLQRLVLVIQEDFNRLSGRLMEVVEYMKTLEELSPRLRAVQSKCDEMEKNLEQMKEDQEHVFKQCQMNSDSRVFLDVGGQRFVTTLQRLTKDMSSPFFSNLLAEKWDPKSNSESNPLFIDRDGRLFDHILKYLRTGEINIDDKTIRKELLTEARYYQFKSLQHDLEALAKKEEASSSFTRSHEALNSSPPTSPAVMLSRSRSSPYGSTTVHSTVSRGSHSYPLAISKARLHPADTASSWRTHLVIDAKLNVFIGSGLLTPEYEEKLLEFIGPEHEQSASSWRLIYRASEHGFDAADFHRCCDTHAPTVSIIQSDFGNIFGGYTAVPWSSAPFRADQADSTAFLFTLKNSVNVPPSKFPIAKEHEKSAISHNPTCGPNFGSPKNVGSDLCLRNKFNEKSNCVFFPRSYVDTSEQGNLVFAKRYFACKEVEVFALTHE